MLANSVYGLVLVIEVREVLVSDRITQIAILCFNVFIYFSPDRYF